MNFNATRPKVPHTWWSTTHEPQISLGFALRSLVFQIIEVFDLPYRLQWWISNFRKKIVKNRRRKISKLQKQCICEDHWEENSGEFWKNSKVIWRRRFEVVARPIRSHISENNKKKYHEKSKAQNFKNPKHYFPIESRLKCWSTTRETQISLHFALRSIIFQIHVIEVFNFPIGYKFEIFEKKSFKIGNSKFKKSQKMLLWSLLIRKFRRSFKVF